LYCSFTVGGLIGAGFLYLNILIDKIIDYGLKSGLANGGVFAVTIVFVSLLLVPIGWMLFSAYKFDVYDSEIKFLNSNHLNSEELILYKKLKKIEYKMNFLKMFLRADDSYRYGGGLWLFTIIPFMLPWWKFIADVDKEKNFDTWLFTILMLLPAVPVYFILKKIIDKLYRKSKVLRDELEQERNLPTGSQQKTDQKVRSYLARLQKKK